MSSTLAFVLLKGIDEMPKDVNVFESSTLTASQLRCLFTLNIKKVIF